MATSYKIIKGVDGKEYWWRVYGHRGGRTYEVGEPQEVGKGRAVIRRNVASWHIDDEQALLRELITNLNQA